MTDLPGAASGPSLGLLAAVFTALADDLEDGVFVHDLQGRLTLANSTLGRWLGEAPARLVGRSLRDLWPGGPAERDLADLPLLQAGGEVEREEDRPLEVGVHRLHTVKVGLHDPQRGVVGVLVRMRDLEARRRPLARQLQEQKLEVLGRLTAGIVHDFNNVLTMLSGQVELLQRAAPAGTPLGDIVEGLRRAVDHGGALARQLLGFLRNEPRARRPVDLNDLVADVGLMLRRALPRGVQLEVRTSPSPAVVQGDRTALMQMLLNLCHNACDAMPAGGQLTLTCDGLTEGEGEAEQSVALRVCDTGTGLAPAVRQLVFEPFMSGKPGGQGTGLGLAVVADVLAWHGGRIDCRSEPGQGTCFLLRLPTVAPEQAGGFEPTVVLVEGDAEVRRLTGIILEQSGYRVVSLPGAERLVEVVWDEKPALVMVEESQLGTSPQQALEELRRSGLSAPVLVTGTLLMPLAGYPLLRKPYGSEQLLQAVRLALARS